MLLQVRYEPLPIYEDPIVVEVINFLIFTIIAVVIIRLVRVFRATNWLTDSNPLHFEDENRIVSPFLMEELDSGEAVFANSKNRILTRVVALLLILIFVTVPFCVIMREDYFNTFLAVMWN
ncbi:hypothetical protein POV27_03150 [Aureisphaera galaxeae]|uniref:hypothetical protein n=1 Tax=Aureisphaera galaxeae TaxID=1538023 RepID=UPI00234FC86B|nr:hypothetical protein [Aureisphaera galaxeae]MDC8003030.1 hypothetical protein [Aureisphaera galaxeae]